MAERALRAAGHRTGFYSSPHLLRYEERVRIDGEPLGERALVAAVEEVREASAGLELTYFEFGTALAFAAFREARVDVQVLETGLGGRLDSTNVCAPIAAAITALGLDHTQILGDTLEQIAFEKAGILKPGLACAVAAQPPGAQGVLEARAREVGARLLFEGPDFALEGARFRGPERSLDGVRVGLRGPHQRHNAAVALALLDLAGAALAIPDHARRTGIAEALWPGRLQIVVPAGAKPGVELALDGAHNPPAALALAGAVTALWKGRDLTLVFGALGDKDLPPMLSTLLPLGRRAILVAPGSPRARPPESYLAEAQQLIADVEIAPSAEAALARALAVTPAGGLVLVCGSLYLVAEALAAVGG